MGYTYDNGMVAIWMSDEKKNTENITEDDAMPLFLLMKQAIAMGWDCPRAKVLLKIRDNMGEVFTIQTIGRLRRMPERVHYENPILDYCYVYTTDSEWKTGLLRNFSDAYEATHLFLKDKCKSFKLTREVKSKEDEIDEKDVYKRIFEHFKSKYGTGKDLNKNKQLLETAGYDFSDSIKTQVRKDKITHTTGIAEDSGDHVTISVAVKTHRDGAKLMTAANYIGSAIGMNYYRMGVILAKLFKLNKFDRYDIQDLPPKEYLAFVVNNQEKLKDEVSEIKAGLVEQRESFGHTTEIEFTIPRDDLFCFDSSDTQNFVVETNAYENYSSSMINSNARSKTERLLELYVEDHKDKIDWIYKNGDNGLKYFGIVYGNGVGQIREFYPDYIIKKKDGSIWIIEAKGGKKWDGTSNNIDINAP
jgi:type III restriction enzyme